jgi:hypothetical protein
MQLISYYTAYLVAVAILFLAALMTYKEVRKSKYRKYED